MMASPKRARDMCTNMSEVFQLTIQAQTRTLARATKESSTKDSVRETMRADCARLGMADIDLDLPPVVHVAGTKGKGSTCALLESILRQGKLRTGLFTSPHLVDVRERIRVNGNLLSASTFEEHVMDTYRLLGPDRMATIGFFQFMTLTAFRIFSLKTLKREEIDVLILETGIGGRLDFTNVLDKPLCCAITRLDYDHTDLLGNTIELIAGEKAGIIKDEVKVFTPSSQVQEGLTVIESVSERHGAPLELVPPLEQDTTGELAIGIGGGEHQLENGAVAWAMAKHVFDTVRPNEIIPREVFKNGLAQCRFPGRAQVEKSSDGLVFYMDGAHTPFSVECASRWFHNVAPSNERKALVFHCSQDRDAASMLKMIHQLNPDIKQAFFLPPTTGVNAGSKSYHDELAVLWQNLGDDCIGISYKEGPREFKALLNKLRETEGLKHVCVIGSFYIVGDALKYWVDGWNVEKAFT